MTVCRLLFISCHCAVGLPIPARHLRRRADDRGSYIFFLRTCTPSSPQERAMATEAKAQPRISPLAGKPAPKEMLINLDELNRQYLERLPDLSDPTQLVAFGTSGHRGTPFKGTFTEAHIAAITQAICD